MKGQEQRRVDRVARWYLEEQLEFDKRLIWYHYRTIRPYLRGPRGLELGPAEGQMTAFLLDDFESLTVVDGSARLLAQIAPARHLVRVHALFDQFKPDERFNSIVMNRILEHVDHPVRLLRRAKRWLAANGRIIVGVPNAFSFHRLVAVHMGLLRRPTQLNERDTRLGHRRVYSGSRLLDEVRAAGLRVVATGGVFFKPLSNQQIQDTWTEEMMDGFFELGKQFPEHAAEVYVVCRP